MNSFYTPSADTDKKRGLSIMGTESEIAYHRHCQATVLAAHGVTGSIGATWSTISNLVSDLTNLPENWINHFNDNNSNITEDFAAILEILNASIGKINTRIVTIENKDKNLVHTIGNETINGDKTFNNTIYRNMNGGNTSAI